MMRRLLLATALLLAAATARAETAPPLGEGDSLADFAHQVCREAPQSEVCAEADRLVRARLVKALLALGETGRRDDYLGDITPYADHPFPEVRAAALAAMARLWPGEAETPLLLEALNDPVPAVRQAALAALRQSGDPEVYHFVQRAADDQGSSLQPDPEPDAGALGIAPMAGSQPLRFAADREDGFVPFITDEPLSAVVRHYNQLTGQEAVPLAELKALLLPDWARTKGLAFYQAMGERLQTLGDLPLAEQILAQYYLGSIMQLSEGGDVPGVLSPWFEAEDWSEVQVLVLARDPLLDFPSQLLMLYRDRLLGKTGFAVQWLPAEALPDAFQPRIRHDPAQPTPVAALEELEAAEATLWEAVVWQDSLAAYQAYLAALPKGAHAEEARAAVARLTEEARLAEEQAAREKAAAEAEKAAAEKERAATEETAGTPEKPPGESATVTTAAGVTLTVATPLWHREPILVTFSGLDTGSRSPWASIMPPDAPDTAWQDWSYLPRGRDSFTLPGQRPGLYEIRLYLEGPREIIARLPVEVLSTASGPPALTLEGPVKAGERITVHFANLPGESGDWITIVAPGTPDTSWGSWSYTDGKPDGTVVLPGQPAGEWELRAYVERPRRELITRTTITIEP